VTEWRSFQPKRVRSQAEIDYAERVTRNKRKAANRRRNARETAERRRVKALNDAPIF
jgi:hypothetical protein